jgi:hypothetical protein
MVLWLTRIVLPKAAAALDNAKGSTNNNHNYIAVSATTPRSILDHSFTAIMICCMQVTVCILRAVLYIRLRRGGNYEPLAARYTGAKDVLNIMMS